MPAPTIPSATHSHNVKFYLWVTSAYVEVAGFKNISGPKEKVGVSDATTLTSASSTKEKIAGLIDSGSLSGTLIFRTAVNTTLRATLRTMQGVQVQAADGTGATTGSSWQFSAFITAIGPDFPEDDCITVDIEMEISGPVTYAAAT